MSTHEKVIQAARLGLKASRTLLREYTRKGYGEQTNEVEELRGDIAVIESALLAHDAAGKVEWVRVDPFRERADLPNGKWLGVFSDGFSKPQWTMYEDGRTTWIAQDESIELAKAAAVEAARGAK